MINGKFSISMEETIVTLIYTDLTRKTDFFEEVVFVQVQ